MAVVDLDAAPSPGVVDLDAPDASADSGVVDLDAPEEGSLLDYLPSPSEAAALAAQVGLPIVGAAVGGLPGAAVGGLAGSALAQKLRGEDLSLRRTVVDTALSVIPGGRVARVLPGAAAKAGAKQVLNRAAGGAIEGAALTAGSTIAAESRLPSAEELALGTVVGGAAGEVGRRLDNRVRARAAAAKPTASAQPGVIDLDAPAAGAPEAGVVAEAATTPLAEAGPGFRRLPGEPTTAAGPTPVDRFTPETVDSQWANQPEELRGVLRAIVADNQDAIAKQTGGVQSAALQEEMASLFIPDNAMLPSGTALNAPQIRSLRNTLTALASKRHELETALLKSPDDATAQAAFDKTRTDLDTFLVNFAGARSESGRALGAFAGGSKALSPDETAAILRLRAARTIEQRRGKLVLDGQPLSSDDLFDRLQRSASPEEQIDLLEKVKRESPGAAAEALRDFYFAAILSRPITHVRNITGNLTDLALAPIKIPLAAARAKAISRVTGEAPTTTYGELVPFARGARVGAAKGMRQFVEVLKQGATSEELADPELLVRVAGGKESPTELAATASTQPGRTVPRAGFLGSKALSAGVSRSLSAADKFFRAIREETSRAQGAFARGRRLAMGEGLKGAAMKDRAREIEATLLNYSSLSEAERAALSPAIIEAADNLGSEVSRVSARAVYQEDPGKLASGLSAIKSVLGPRGGLLVDQVLPFVKTPANLTRRGLLLSGFGPAWAEKEAEIAAKGLTGLAAERVRAEVGGEGLAGLLALAPLLYLAERGLIHGDAPEDPKDKAQFLASGRKANSIDIGGRNVGLNLFGPVLLPATAVANAVQTAKTSKDFREAIGAIALRQGASLLDQSFLFGLSDLFQLLTDRRGTSQTGSERVETFLGTRAASFIPGAVQDVAEVVDAGGLGAEAPVRQPTTITEPIKAAIPGLRSEVPPKVDVTGRVATRPALIPDVTTIEDTGVKAELDALNASRPPKSKALLEDVPASGVPATDVQSVGAAATPVKVQVQLFPNSKPVTLEGENSTAYRLAESRLVNRALTNKITSPAYQKLVERGPETESQRRKQIAAIVASAQQIIRNRAKGAILKARAKGDASAAVLTVEGLLPPSRTGLYAPLPTEE